MILSSAFGASTTTLEAHGHTNMTERASVNLGHKILLSGKRHGWVFSGECLEGIGRQGKQVLCLPY
ncbi:MAG: hypothetical protein A2611_02795 [Candidatus Komeilibacteria bacterium RIFOXYD1_FULL_37_29]|nr:MAG: hypothetical protein A2611_02795 [Candidatus Komeilibacteria bacterium RIFOXYD1_FULL_37_29]